MQRDRFLLGILVGTGVLVLLALILFGVRQGQSQYSAEQSPAATLQNYLLALQKRDYTRAYGYLAEGPGRPSLAQFQQSFLSYPGEAIANTPVEIGETVVDEANRSAVVQVTLLHGSQGWFESGYRESNAATLVQQNGAWKIQTVPYPYGVPGVPDKPPAPPEAPSPSPTP